MKAYSEGRNVVPSQPSALQYTPMWESGTLQYGSFTPRGQAQTNVTGVAGRIVAEVVVVKRRVCTHLPANEPRPSS